jgi:acyl-coenzyme A synthetase/AMP-(fatty) acid ligase/thioesterase domain-containing protein
MISRFDTEQHLKEAWAAILVECSDRPAVVVGRSATTYQQLDTIARNVCGYLHSTVSPSTKIIGLMASPGPQAIGALLGIIFSGRAYLPLDPLIPAANRDRMISEAGVDLVLTDEIIASCRPYPLVVPSAPVNPSDAACVLYTSATTGQPKGVVLSHRCVLFHARAYAFHMRITKEDRVALFPSLHVGASVSNLFAALLSGATLYPMSPVVVGFDGLLDRLVDHPLTVMHMVPSLFRRIARDPRAPHLWCETHHLKLGGEAMTGADVLLFRQLKLEKAHLMNGLGITEAGGNVTFGEVSMDTPIHGFVSIGRMVEGISATVIPAHDAAHEEGELVVRSQYLASGYIGGRDQTAFTFHEDGTVSFRTGDLVRSLADGGWIHLGRIDQVVKINGVRVSLLEVEGVLRNVPHVRDAIAMVRCDSDAANQLCGILVADVSMTLLDIRQHVSERLSPAMLPSFFYQLHYIPRAQGGKVDRTALAAMVAKAEPMPGAPFRPPSDALEAQVLNVFRQILSNQSLGVDDAFLDAGGDSLKAADVTTQMKREFGVEVMLAEVFRHATPALLTTAIRAGNTREADHPWVVLRSGDPGRILFLIPGAGSDVVALWDLAQSMPQGIHVVGFQYPGLDGKTETMDSVPELAAYFLKHLRLQQPGGPYQLAGTSFGGMVAFEMARQLERAGEPISFLGLLDTYAPGYLTFKRRLPRKSKIRALCYWCRPIGMKNDHTWSNVLRGLREKYALFTARPPLPWRQPYAHRFYRLMAACFHAGRNYTIQPIQTPVTLFLAEQELPEDLFDRDACLGWRDATRGGVRVVPISGRHGHHIRPPHANALAYLIAKHLANNESAVAAVADRGSSSARSTTAPTTNSVQ